MFQPLPRFAPVHRLGRTGFTATAVGIGDLADASGAFETQVATLQRALAAGLNVIDTAPMYEDGLSERLVGAALRGVRREEVFVIDKVDLLEEPVRPQVEASLARLGLAQADLFAFHNVSTLEAWRALAAPGGGFAQLGACRDAGLTRFRGLSSHHPDVLREALESGLCDVVMFPLGPFCDRRYAEQVLPLARARGVGVVGFKTFGAGKLLGDTEGYSRPLQLRPRGKLSSGGQDGAEAVLPRLSVEECVRYSLTLAPDVALLGMSHPNEQDAALAAASRFAPLSAEQLQQVRARAAEAIQGKGRIWWDPV